MIFPATVCYSLAQFVSSSSSLLLLTTSSYSLLQFFGCSSRRLGKGYGSHPSVNGGRQIAAFLPKIIVVRPLLFLARKGRERSLSVGGGRGGSRGARPCVTSAQMIHWWANLSWLPCDFSNNSHPRQTSLISISLINETSNTWHRHRKRNFTAMSSQARNLTAKWDWLGHSFVKMGSIVKSEFANNLEKF